MHIGLLLLELGISDYDLNIKNYFHPNFKLRMAKWTFLACGVNEITKLKNTTDYYYYYFLFKFIQCLNLLFTLSITVLSGEWLIWCTLYVESNQSWNDLLLLGLSEPGGTGAIDPPPILAGLLTLLKSGGQIMLTTLVLFLPHPDFQTFLRPWLCKSLLSDSEWGCPPKINCTSSWIHLETWSAVLICQGFSSSGFHERFREG